jgi:methionine-rich copper-binding protein CopC
VTPILRRVLILPAVSILIPRLVETHAILLRSSPSANQVVHGEAVPIELWFNSRVDGKMSRLSLVGPTSTVRELTIEQPSHDSVASRASKLAPGWHVLRWQILAEDGHITRDEVAFRAN